MEKSTERQILEEKINKLFNAAFRRALIWFVLSLPVLTFGADRYHRFFNKRIRNHRVAWLEALKELERLEAKEGFPAASAYIRQIKELCLSLPKDLTSAYYPFAGTDMYWGSVLSTLILEDKNFNTSEEHNYSMWWGQDDYSLERCGEIESMLKKEGLLPNTTRITYITGDSTEARDDNDFNEANVVFISKSGNKLPRLLRGRFKGQEIKFGAIIAVNEPASKKNLDALLEPYGYRCVFELKGGDFLIPYAMSLGRLYLYLKCRT